MSAKVMHCDVFHPIMQGVHFMHWRGSCVLLVASPWHNISDQGSDTLWFVAKSGTLILVQQNATDYKHISMANLLRAMFDVGL